MQTEAMKKITHLSKKRTDKYSLLNDLNLSKNSRDLYIEPILEIDATIIDIAIKEIERLQSVNDALNESIKKE